MESLTQRLRELFTSYDSSQKPLSEMIVFEAIAALRSKDDTTEPPFEWSAELMAFDFVEVDNNQEDSANHFGPKMTFRKEDGTYVEIPSVKQVTDQMIHYWAQRSNNAVHPVLRARYANLVWDLQYRVTGTSPSHTIAQAAIDSVLEIVRSEFHTDEMDVIGKLGHALSLAISLNDSARIGSVRDAILDYEAAIAEDDKPGLWGFAFDLLWDKNKISLSDDQKQKVIGDLEARLQRTARPSTDSKLDPWAAEAAATRLASSYRKLGQRDDVGRVLLEFGGAFEKMASEASALLAMTWLGHVHDVYRQYGLNDEAEKIAARLQELGPNAVSEMKPISARVEISKKEMEDYVSAFSSGSLQEMLSLIASHYVPDKAQIETQLKEYAQKAPLAFMIRSKLHDERGRPIASVGPLEADIDGNIVKFMSENLAASTVFLREVMKALCARADSSSRNIADYIFQSPVFEESKRPIIEAGLDDYFAGRYVSSLHVLIPQIESAVRVLLQKTGGSIYKPNRIGGFDLKVLDALLREPVVCKVLGEDITLYLRVLLADQRGWNLRNNVCHGLLPAAAFGAEMSDRVVHVLLCLAQVREQQTPRE